MGLIILIFVVILIYFLEKRIYKTIYTPSIMLGGPFLVICILYNFYYENLGYYPLNYDVLYIWIFGLILFFSMGCITTLIVGQKNRQSAGSLILTANDSLLVFNKGLLNVVFACSIIAILVLRQAYSIFVTSGPDEVENYLGKGIQGHLVVSIKFFSIASFISLFLPISKINKLKNAFIVFMSIALSLLYGTKSGVLILIVGYYLIWVIYFNKKIKVTHILLAISLGFGIFYLSYSVLFGRLAPIDFIWQHMVMYYVSGTASMSVYFSNHNPSGVEPEMIFRSFYNTVNLLTGNSEDIKGVISDKWTVIGPGAMVNVKTFFGTIYLYGGLGGGIVAVIIFSFLSYISLYWVQKGSKNIFNICLYVYLISTFCFGWFDFYLNTIALIEYMAITFLFGLFLVKK